MTWFILRFFNPEPLKQPGLIIETIEYTAWCVQSLKA